MWTKSRQIKSVVMLAALVLALAAVMLTPQPVSARVCPAPGGGYAGALNMSHDAKMLIIPMVRNNPNGNIGMGIAVMRSACP